MPLIAPNCKTCRTDTQLRDAGIFNSIPFWYCENCKIEVDFRGWSVEAPKKPSKTEELDSYLAEKVQEMDAESGVLPIDEEDLEEDPAWYRTWYP